MTAKLPQPSCSENRRGHGSSMVRPLRISRYSIGRYGRITWSVGISAGRQMPPMPWTQQSYGRHGTYYSLMSLTSRTNFSHLGGQRETREWCLPPSYRLGGQRVKPTGNYSLASKPPLTLLTHHPYHSSATVDTLPGGIGGSTDSHGCLIGEK